MLVAEYRGAALAEIQPRLDAHLARRGTWQRAMFAVYYQRFNLKMPPVLMEIGRGAADVPTVGVNIRKQNILSNFEKRHNTVVVPPP